ncbi:aldo/keto reductase [Streptomyces sp. GQFP]|uniref:aldo/keto reductase n=1 Tax=Streptomyces sp. GQFP TaxID=2907545 RepID=UPI001F36001E|nr:aldo/keto reductase [Streptomyces sp. GQFP]UIX29155.1 aldo/keto reductase [Streptomyces sp. GQFP]
MSNIPLITLNNGVRLPQLGFGTWPVPAEAVTTALEAGYRGIDTASIYGNEKEIGGAIAASGVPREELFITSKLWNADQGYDSTLRAFDASLDKLGLDHVDLYLIHWPLPARGLYLDTWRAFEKLYADGRTKAIGVSNFPVAQLQHLLDEGSIVPAVNQIELHPNFPQAELRAFHAAHNIATEAWSPLGQGKGLLEDPALATIAAKHTKTPAQIVLRWHIQLGNIVIPKSATPTRITENLHVFDFELDAEDLAAIDTLDTATRIGEDPSTWDYVG